MTDYNNGAVWGWNGGPCPVHPKTEVRCWLACGGASIDRQAHQFRWDHIDSYGNVIAFQVITPYVEPKTIWATRSLYSGKILRAFDDEDIAYRYANINPSDCSIAKYQEVKE